MEPPLPKLIYFLSLVIALHHIVLLGLQMSQTITVLRVSGYGKAFATTTQLHKEQVEYITLSHLPLASRPLL